MSFQLVGIILLVLSQILGGITSLKPRVFFNMVYSFSLIKRNNKKILAVPRIPTSIWNNALLMSQSCLTQQNTV